MGKAAILFWLVLTTPDGNRWIMDTGLTADDCRAESVPGFFVSYYDGESAYPIPAGAVLTCEAVIFS